MSKYLEIFRSAKSWLDDPEVLDTMEGETTPRAGLEDRPSVSVEPKKVVCLEFTDEPREVKKGSKEFAWVNAVLLEPAVCWFKKEDEEKEMPAGTKVAMNVARHVTQRRCLKSFEPLKGKKIAIANLGRRIKTKQGKAFDYRAMLYEDLKKKAGKKK